MLQSFEAGLREALQCSFLLLLVISHPTAGRQAGRLLAGTALAFAAGFPLSYLPGISTSLPDNETWTALRYLAEFTVFYAGLSLAIVKPGAPMGNKEGRSYSTALVALGFALYFFEARGLGFLVHDIGLMREEVASALFYGLAGTALGFSPVFLLRHRVQGLGLERSFNPASLLVLLASLQFAFGGLGELDNGSILVSMQMGLQEFLHGLVEQVQSVLMINSHAFIKSPLSGLAGFLSGDRTSTALLVLVVMTPPVYLIMDLFSQPDPFVSDIRQGAQRRLKMAFFRADLVYRSAPAFISFIIILVALHAVNVSMNPMSEPVPMPVRAEGAADSVISLPLSDRHGDFSDGKLRKYVYYYGAKQIIFLAILRPDGTAGVALDECEICKPAEWNKAAKGYAQRGDTLVCKYCMTPIAISTVNKPGGCNPIPVPFIMDDDGIVIELAELIRLYNAAQALEKEGTHF